MSYYKKLLGAYDGAIRYRFVGSLEDGGAGNDRYQQYAEIIRSYSIKFDKTAKHYTKEQLANQQYLLLGELIEKIGPALLYDSPRPPAEEPPYIEIFEEKTDRKPLYGVYHSMFGDKVEPANIFPSSPESEYHQKYNTYTPEPLYQQFAKSRDYMALQRALYYVIDDLRNMMAKKRDEKMSDVEKVGLVEFYARLGTLRLEVSTYSDYKKLTDIENELISSKFHKYYKFVMYERQNIIQELRKQAEADATPLYSDQSPYVEPIPSAIAEPAPRDVADNPPKPRESKFENLRAHSMRTEFRNSNEVQLRIADLIHIVSSKAFSPDWGDDQLAELKEMKEKIEKKNPDPRDIEAIKKRLNESPYYYYDYTVGRRREVVNQEVGEYIGRMRQAGNILPQEAYDYFNRINRARTHLELSRLLEPIYNYLDNTAGGNPETKTLGSRAINLINKFMLILETHCARYPHIAGLAKKAVSISAEINSLSKNSGQEIYGTLAHQHYANSVRGLFSKFYKLVIPVLSHQYFEVRRLPPTVLAFPDSRSNHNTADARGGRLAEIGDSATTKKNGTLYENSRPNYTYDYNAGKEVPKALFRSSLPNEELNSPDSGCSIA